MKMQISEQIQKHVDYAKRNPKEFRIAFERFLCSNSLIDFIKCGWHSLEPGVPFVDNFAVRAICDHLQAVTDGSIKRLLINVPPGSSKSLSSSVFWPAWEWGPKGLAHYRYVSFSHEQKLATRDLVRCRDLMMSEWYQELYGHIFTFKRDQNMKMYYENSMTGWRQACAAEGLTGRRGDRVIGDDPHSVKGAESDAKREAVIQIVSETVPTRLNKQGESAIIYIMQRVHEKDTTGHILASELGYEHLMIPMRYESDRRCFSIVKPTYIKEPVIKDCVLDRRDYMWRPVKEVDNHDGNIRKMYSIDPRTEDGQLMDPIRFNEQAVSDLEKALSSWGGSYAISGQLQQRPSPRGGGLFKKSDFQIIELNDIDIKSGRIVRGWDLAASTGKTSAYTAGVKMMLDQQGRIVILDVVRFRGTPGTVNDKLLTTAKIDGKSVIIDMPQDPGQAGKSQKVAFAKLLHGYNCRFSPETGSKENRASPLAAQSEALNVYLVRAAWNDIFIAEACLFPNGQYKDQIDAASRAYSALLRNKKQTVSGGGLLITG